MDKEKLREIVYIFLAIIASIIIIKLVIWLLPVALGVILALYIYNRMKKVNIKQDDKKERTKKKKIVIIDEVKDENN